MTTGLESSLFLYVNLQGISTWICCWHKCEGNLLIPWAASICRIESCQSYIVVFIPRKRCLALVSDLRIGGQSVLRMRVKDREFFDLAWVLDYHWGRWRFNLPGNYVCTQQLIECGYKLHVECSKRGVNRWQELKSINCYLIEEYWRKMRMFWTCQFWWLAHTIRVCRVYFNAGSGWRTIIRSIHNR